MNEIRSFEESLLYHAVTNSQNKTSRLNKHHKFASKLFNDLNMAYSRLTTQHSYELINCQPQQSFSTYLTQIKPTDQSMEVQELQTCARCKKIKIKLKNYELLLQQIESKFIQKQHLLNDRFKQVINELNQTKQQNQKHKNLYEKTLTELSNLKDSLRPPKINLKSSRTDCKLRKQSFNRATQNLSTVESLVDPQSKRLAEFIKKQFNRMNKTVQKPLFESIIQTNQTKYFDRSDSSTVRFDYTESQHDIPPQGNEIQKSNLLQLNMNSSPRLRFSKSKLNHKNSVQQDPQFEILRLRFHNDNLRHYNKVLLEHTKPKTLANKIFNKRI